MALAAALTARGLQPAVDGRTVVIAIEGDQPYDAVRDALADLGLPLIRHGAAPARSRGPVHGRGRRRHGGPARTRHADGTPTGDQR